MFLPNKFKPTKQKKFNLQNSREKFFKRKSKNLEFLLNKRFNWMKRYLKKKNYIIELGSGNGLLKEVLKNEKIMLSDIEVYNWIDLKIDMNNFKLDKKFKKKLMFL